MSFKDVAIKAAKTSGEIVREYFGQPLQVQFKSRKDLVTQADVKAERSIVSIIEENFPDHSITGEELPAHQSSSIYNWLIDPIDGTTNFIAGIPMFSISLVLCDRNTPILAVIYDPLRSEIFYAEQGKGAFLNGRRITVGTKSELEDCVVSYSRSYHPTYEAIRSAIEMYEVLLPRVRAMRQLGGSALDFCYVASGRLDATVTPLTDPKLEHPAGCLIVDEAGGKSTDFYGKKWDLESPSIISANHRIHSAIVDLLNE